MTIHIPRLEWSEHFMLQAHLVATRSTCDRGPELLLDPGRHGVGAVIVRDKRIIASGYNGSPPGAPHCSDPPTCSCCDMEIHPDHQLNDGDACPICTQGSCTACKGQAKLQGGHKMVEGHCVRTIHSEMNALMQCGLDETTPKGGTIYCTASPCYDCAKAIIRAGIQTVIYGEEYDSRYGLSPTVAELFGACRVNISQLRLEIVDGRVRRNV